MKIYLKTNNDNETYALGKSFGSYLKPGSNILVDGDLAAGKTVFAKGVGAGLGITDHIKSPSYTLLCMYEGKWPFYHFDAYNLSGMDDFYDLGFDEYIDGDGVVLIEWASVVADGFPASFLHIKIDKNDLSDERHLTFSADDDFHNDILKEWQQHENISL